MDNDRKILGIIGGMGPAATIELQRLIIENTRAIKDQDHIETLIHNDTLIPDRTRSLIEDNGSKFVDAIVDSGNKLISAGATFLCIPCNTAHARYDIIQGRLSRPVIDMIALVTEHILVEKLPQPILVLGTAGALNYDVFGSRFSRNGISFILPDQDQQKNIHDAIYKIKAGMAADQVGKLKKVITENMIAHKETFRSVLLGCTELSLLADKLGDITVPVIDPLQVLARHIVKKFRLA